MKRTILLLAALLAVFAAAAQQRKDPLSAAENIALERFLASIDRDDVGIAIHEPSKALFNADRAAVKEHLEGRYGSPSLNRDDMVIWDRDTLVVTLSSATEGGRRQIRVSFMRPHPAATAPKTFKIKTK